MDSKACKCVQVSISNKQLFDFIEVPCYALNIEIKQLFV
jgi:hypothetical protein